MSNLLLGCHVSMKKPDYLLGSLHEALSYGANCFMIYNGAPQNIVRAPIDALKIKEFQHACKQDNIDLANVIVHAPYIINLATKEANKHKFAINILIDEIKRTNAIGCKYLVVHPGNAIGITKQEAIWNIASVINHVHKQNDNVILCLETMSGKGSEVGISFDELAQIIKLVDNKHLIGVCLDTCHINDAGYKVNTFDELLNEFDKIIGLKYLKVIHLNDSKNLCGSRSDRHENIGYGTIGFNNLLSVVYHDKLLHLPKILETPYFNDKPPYKYEIEMIRQKKFVKFKD